jgi:hypothetical protein
LTTTRKPPGRRGGGHGDVERQTTVVAPPHSLDAEKSLLGGILLDGATLVDVQPLLSASDFYRDPHRKIFEAMCSVSARGKPVDRVTVRDALVELGSNRARVEEYLEDLDREVPVAANLEQYALIVREKALRRRSIEVLSSTAQLGYEHHGDVGEYLQIVARRVDDLIGGTSPGRAVLRRSVLPITPEEIRRDPPRREYMLTIPSSGIGVLPQGKVALLAARGGSGKSWAFMQLAVAVATGTTWLGDGVGWKASLGRVLLVLAEEDAAEALRRVHHAVKAAGIISDADLHQLADNLVILPLCGEDVALTVAGETDSPGLPETTRAGELRRLIAGAAAEGRPFVLVVLDPLSRFAAVDVEKDNGAATRFVQVIETLTRPECGRPTVFLSHHASKEPMDGKRDKDSADPIRGASALVDGVRWAAILKRRPRHSGAPELLDLRVVKTNYGAIPEPMILCRPPDGHGTLRVASDDDLAAYAGGDGGRVVAGEVGERDPDLEARVLLEVTREPCSGSEIARRLGLNKDRVLKACTTLHQAGQITRKHHRADWTVPTVLTVPTVPAEPSRDGSNGSAPKGAGTGTVGDRHGDSGTGTEGACTRDR